MYFLFVVFLLGNIFRMGAHRSLFPGGVCKIKCKADIAGGVWATSQSQVSIIIKTKYILDINNVVMLFFQK